MMIRSALDQGAVATLLLSEALVKRRAVYHCRQCKHEWIVTVTGTPDIPDCVDCGAAADQVRENQDASVDLIDELSLLAEQSAAKVRLISVDTEEGATLNLAFGGMAALLRWAWS